MTIIKKNFSNDVRCTRTVDANVSALEKPIWLLSTGRPRLLKKAY
jgi:hypothetical protein